MEEFRKVVEMGNQGVESSKWINQLKEATPGFTWFHTSLGGCGKANQ